jgi:hypothetical protein
MMENNEKYKSKTSGKISLVYDPECKVRPIAILDYFSQVVLRPIHKILFFSILKGFKQDRTFNQSPFNDWKLNDEPFYSLDLSSATDRFPIELQQRILSLIFNERISLLWKTLLIDRSYSTPEGTNVRYSVGQPMGSYSS